MDDADKLVNEILETVASDKKIQLYPILNRIATIEKDISDSILRGETYYYKRGKSKPPTRTNSVNPVALTSTICSGKRSLRINTVTSKLSLIGW